MEQLPPEYQHEPRVALAGGADGMELIRRIVRQAHSQLEPGGALILEVGDGRGAIERSFPELALTWLTTSAGDDMVFLAHREDLPA